ncbi:MAG: hypothetical protein KDD68_15930 [Bdellovibrionales bacterium]|nr:hypothetical protein [Bdellovibrionales bacterium]
MGAVVAAVSEAEDSGWVASVARVGLVPAAADLEGWGLAVLVATVEKEQPDTFD